MRVPTFVVRVVATGILAVAGLAVSGGSAQAADPCGDHANQSSSRYVSADNKQGWGDGTNNTVGYQTASAAGLPGDGNGTP